MCRSMVRKNCFLVCVCTMLVSSGFGFQIVPGKGANTPFTIMEGEDGKLAGGATIRTLDPTPANLSSSPELEASGRKLVELNATGESVSWVNPVDSCNTINIRQSIPDAPNGGGTDATLNLYINGQLRQSIPLTSKQTIVYGDFEQTPSSGNPYVFYDESRTFITGEAIHKGDTIMLRKDAANTAAHYWIDCIDLESTAAKARPANSLSVADYGASGKSTDNVNKAFDDCCNAAKAQGKIVWVPAGRYYLTNFSPNGVTIAGEGMWYSTLHFTMGQLQGRSCNFRDFCVDAVTVRRDQGMGGVNMKGNDWVVERIWAIHGCWAGYWMCGRNGILRDCRTSMCWGDGFNLNNGGPGDEGINLLAENNFTRGCGDDGATIFSDGGNDRIIDGATLRNNTTVAIYAANGMRIAGGKNIRSENNLIMDGCREAGIYIGVFGAAGSDLQDAVITKNLVIRCGNSRSPGGITVNASPGNKNVSLTLSNNVIKDAQFYGLLIGSDRITLRVDSNTIDHPARTAVYIQGGAKGTAALDNNKLINRIPGVPSYKNDAPSTFSVTFGNNNSGIPDTNKTALHPLVEKNANGYPTMSLVQLGTKLHVSYTVPTMSGMADISLYNSSGQRVWNERHSSVQGTSACVYNVQDIGSGLFIVKIRLVGIADNERQTYTKPIAVLQR